MFWPFGKFCCKTYTTFTSLTDSIYLVAWGLTMAAYATNLPLGVYAFDLAKCLVAAFIVRSSACTINDIFDRKMDAGVGQCLY